MTAAILTHPLSVHAFLFGDRDRDSARALVRALDEQGAHRFLSGALQQLSETGRIAVGSELALATQWLLDLDLGRVLVKAWRTQVDLAAAARRTLAAAGATEVVELVTHRVTSAHEPWIDVMVDSAHVATVRFQLCLTFVVQGLVATVRGGRLVGLRAGTCQLTGTLAVAGHQLASEKAQLDLPLVVRLSDGIPLLPPGSATQLPDAG